MRFVGYSGAAILLGLGLAAITFDPAAAQTTVIGGDGRPDVVVDHSVLNSLGPQPTLPDLLLGRRPMAPVGAPVKLHRPTGKTAVAHLKAPKPAKSKAVASAAPKQRAPKAAKTVAKAEAKPTKHETKTADVDMATLRADSKKLASNFEPPPPPPTRPTAASANADMPGAAIVPAKPAPKTPSATNKSLSTSVTTAPQKLAAAEPPAATEPSPAQKAANPSPSAETEASKPAPDSAKAEAPKAEATKAESKVALLTPPPIASTTADGGVALTIPFAKDGATLTDDARGALVTIAKRALADTTIQLQVLAYASGDEDSASKARRLSLSRALAVRSFLIDQGVHSTRIEVRALGNKVPEGPADRVDLLEQKH